MMKLPSFLRCRQHLTSGPRRAGPTLAVTLAVALGSAPFEAQAATVTYGFSGTVTLASGTAAALQGLQFFGQLIYDPAAAVSYNGVNYTTYTAPTGAISLSAAGGTLQGGTAQHEVVTNLSFGFLNQGDLLRTVLSDAVGSGALAGFGSLQLFQQVELGALQSLALPGQMLALGDPQLRRMGLAGTASNASFQTVGYFEGGIGCFSADAGACANVVTVPEPGTAGLVALGLLASLRCRRSQPAPPSA